MLINWPWSSDVEIDQAANISGWITYQELRWLARAAEKHQRIVEIGSYQGRSTRALGDNTDGVVYAIDDFIGPRDKGNIGLPNFEIFGHNLYDLIRDKKVVPVVADHKEVDVNITPDMVFIDGSHLYEDVKRDIETWQLRLAPGGLLCGHDAQFVAVQKALADTLGKYKVGRGTTIWYVKVP